MRLLFFLTLLLGAVLPAGSQTLNFVNYTTKDGLLSDEVYNMYQDKAGYLWVFSKFGPVRYNGKKFEPYLKNLTLRESFIYCIYENKSGQTWVANSNATVYEIRNDSAFVMPGTQEISRVLRARSNEILKLYQDDSLNFYITGKGPCYQLRPNSDGTYQQRNLSFSFVEDTVLYSINEVGDAVMVYSNRKSIDGLKFINKGATRHYTRIHPKQGPPRIFRNPFYNLNLISPYDVIRGCRKVGDSYYFLYANAFWKFDRNNILSYTTFKTIVTNFTSDNKGYFWVGTVNDGIYKLDSDGKILAHYLEGLTISDLLFDHLGGLWVSSQGKGLFYCSNTQETAFLLPHPLGQSITCLKLIDSTVYVGNAKGEVFTTRSGDLVQVKRANGFGVKDIAKSDSRILLADYTGNIRDFSSGEKLAHDFNVNFIYSKLLKNGDTLVGLTRQSVNYAWQNQLRSVNHYKKKLLTAEIFRNQLWLGTSEGIYLSDLSQVKENRLHDQTLVADTVRSLQRPQPENYSDSEAVAAMHVRGNQLWASTEGNGLFCFLPHQVIHYTKTTGLPDNIVNHFYCWENTYLLSTNSGLYLCNTWSPKNGFGDWTRISSHTILKAILFKDLIYAVSSHGLIVLDRRSLDSQTDRYFINLKAVKANFAEIPTSALGRVKSSVRNLEFEFDVIDFQGKNPFIDFVLTGSVNDSVHTQNNSYRMAQLVPGEYTLRVSTGDSGSSQSTLVIPFFIEPAFWQTTIFKVASVIFMLGLLVFGFWLILRRNKRRQQVKLKNEQLILEYKLIALKAQVNPHFMSNCLSAIQNMVLESDREKATYYLAEFGLLMRRILEHSSKQTISLAEELELLALYIELERLRFDNKFSYHVHVSKNIDPKIYQVPPLILNPIVENAIWHGLLPVHQKRDARLTLDASIENGKLVIVIDDNGVGYKNTSAGIGNHRAGSFGLSITEQRISNWNYLQQGDLASFSIKNLREVNPNWVGTRVSIELPIVYTWEK